MASNTSATTHAAAACAHCGSAQSRVGSAYCCAGCEAVAALLRDQSLDGYYRLAPDARPPIGTPPTRQSHAWLEPLVAKAEADAAGGSICALDLDVQGIHCAACVWLMNETYRRRGGMQVVINPALGKARLVYARGSFDVEGWVSAVEAFGYRFGPSRKRPSTAGRSLTLRLGISIALALNVMLFSLSFYFGLSRTDGDLYRLFTGLSAVLATGVVVIGGGPFFAAAWRGLRQRILHLDLPIAVGIGLVYGTSLIQLARGRGGELVYFDTLNTFVVLMLVGRYLQQRVLERNRRYLLEDDGAEGIFVRRMDESTGRPAAVSAPSIKAGAILLVAPSEVVPVDADLLDGAAAVSTDWITGEPEPRAVAAGGLVPAGSFNAGRSAFTVRARTDFQDSPLVTLLRQAPPRAGGRHLAFWERLARRWVVKVLIIASAGFLLWLPTGADRALDVAVALLVITCPCAIGIALPLAYELSQARLRRAGFFARTADVLDRMDRVRTLLVDKTGTLTMGRLALAAADERGVRTMPLRARNAAYDLASRSGHPVSACVAAALARNGATFDPEAKTTEVPGQGISMRRCEDGQWVLWRLGRASWACPEGGAEDGVTALSRDGALCAAFHVTEVLRPGAALEMRALHDEGYEVALLSGDAPAKVRALTTALGLPAECGLGGLSPQDKANEVLRRAPGAPLYLGDGINDALAFEAAMCAGTVAIDRPVLPGKADFFLVGEGLSPLRHALRAARRLRVVARRVLRLSVSYNVLAVGSCLLGVMSPVRAAVVMPLSSLGILTFTILSLRERVVSDETRVPVPLQPEVAA